MRVLKFGGSSLATPERLKNVIEIVKKAQAERDCKAVVLSAFGGVTDTLITISKKAAANDETYKETLQALETRHRECVEALIPVAKQGEILLALKKLFNELEYILQGVFLVGELSVRCLDKVMSFGEQLSATITSAAMKDDGAEFLDSRKIIKTDSTYGGAKVDRPLTDKLIQEHFSANDKLQIVTGFIASSTDGNTVTLGRGGSDYTAAIIGAALNADEIEIWTDVNGIMTADPNKVRKAFSIKNLSYEEAMELSHFGAKVIYPPTVLPAMECNIPIRVLNSFEPDYIGTVISPKAAPSNNLITGISSISGIALIRIEGSGMVGVNGIAKRLFGALTDINIILITQASSEHTICFAVSPADVTKAEEAINTEFELELKAKLLSPIQIERNLTIVSIVGENMKSTAGVAGHIFSSLGESGVNISAIAQGSSELNISVVIAHEDERRALNALHDEFFFPNRRFINVCLVGTGLIGGELLQQIGKQQEHLKDELGIEVNLVAVANSKKLLINPDGLDALNCKAALENGSPYNNLTALLASIEALNLPHTVLVDCTASPELPNCYAQLLVSNISIVTPNKKGQSASMIQYNNMKKAALKKGVKLLYETSVGAGLPVLSTLNDLLRSGDKILKIEGVLSGTLSYIFNSFDGSKPFSAVVAEARAAGYTEPDPRDDLNGLDVARKILILAREAGVSAEMGDVSIQNLVSEYCRDAGSIEEFFERLKAEDNSFEELRKNAATDGNKLCYMAELADGKISVALKAISNNHPFFDLSGSDNVVSFTTSRYKERPLVVRGPGAGAAVTAAGVFADIIRIAR